MKVFHRIYNDWNLSQRLTLKQYGINVQEGYSRIDIIESADTKPLLSLFDEWGLKTFYWTEYSLSDYTKCEFIAFATTWLNGYPLPDSNNQYEQITYDIKNKCPKCGIGKVQVAPFNIQKEPKWGSKSNFQMNWIFDEIFVRLDVFKMVLEPSGIEMREVLINKTQKTAQTIVQLVIPETTSTLMLKDQPFEECTICLKKKYSPQIRGLFPPLLEPNLDMPIFKSREYFGSGAEAHQQIILTRNLWKRLKELKVNLGGWPVFWCATA